MPARFACQLPEHCTHTCQYRYLSCRYVNVLPYDHNRVQLRACSSVGELDGGPAPAPGRGQPRSNSCPPCPDYINASHVVYEDPQCGFTLRYIACQGPLAATVADFWRMAWTEGVGAVVMLTNTVERGVTKCASYYPAQPGQRLLLRQGQGQGGGGGCGCASPSGACLAEVAAVGCESLQGGDLTATRLRMVAAGQGQGGGSQQAPVLHLRYNAWPDHGTPTESSAIRTMSDLLDGVRDGQQQQQQQGGGGQGRAVVVHCSAGIGRTGTFCSIDILRRRLACLAAAAEARPGSVGSEAVHAALDLPALVHELRRQRCGMVQTLEQYAFVYQALYEELVVGGPGQGVGGQGAGGQGGRQGRRGGGEGHGTPR